MREFSIGDAPTIRGTFRSSENGPLADPTTITVIVRTPAGVESTSTATRVSTGIYTHTVSLTASGTWKIRFKGAGAVTKNEEIWLKVRASGFDSP